MNGRNASPLIWEPFFSFQNWTSLSCQLSKSFVLKLGSCRCLVTLWKSEDIYALPIIDSVCLSICTMKGITMGSLCGLSRCTEPVSVSAVNSFQIPISRSVSSDGVESISPNTLSVSSSTHTQVPPSNLEELCQVLGIQPRVRVVVSSWVISMPPSGTFSQRNVSERFELTPWHIATIQTDEISSACRRGRSRSGSEVLWLNCK